MRIYNGELKREFAQVERVLAMNTAAFPWEEVESFCLALSWTRYLLIADEKERPKNFIWISRRFVNAHSGVRHRKWWCWKNSALSQVNNIPTIVDGTLKDHESDLIWPNRLFSVSLNPAKLYVDRQGGRFCLIWTPECERQPSALHTTPCAAKTRNAPSDYRWYARLCGIRKMSSRMSASCE